MKRIVPVFVTLLWALAGCGAPAAPPPVTQPPADTPSATATPTETPTTSPSPSATAGPTTAPAPTAVDTPRTPSGKPSGTPPQLVLGGDLKGTADKGLGTAKPGYIDFGGHPTTILRNVTWTSWGGDVATATAEAMWIAPGKATVDATWEQAEVRAEKIGTCNGKRAYTRLVWTFPGEQGEQPVPFDACTGISIT